MEMTPVVKWAGGKHQLLDLLKSYMPAEYDTYYEPFIGGGALFLNIAPKKAVINDVNHELYTVYECLQDDELFMSMLNELDIHKKNHSEEYYYEIREMDQKKKFETLPTYKRAARTIYLNKACFNGLYRVNSNGYFNVPSGKKDKDKLVLYSKDNICEVHNYLMKEQINLLCVDFVEACRTAKKGDFIYFDPPYDIVTKQSFTAYSKSNFDRDDQVRLADLFKKLTQKGVKCMLSNHNTDFIRSLYADYNIHVVQAKRSINSKGDGRGPVEEVIITNY